MAPRWATFDCYGTLIDWNAGIRAELARVFEYPIPTPAAAAAEPERGSDGEPDTEGEAESDAAAEDDGS